jgi:hypothetical protein
MSAGTIAAISLAAAAASSAVAAVGSIQSANAQSNAAKYNASVANNNATIAEQNAQLAAKSGEAQAEQQQMKTRALVGGIKANQAAGGVDVDSGSATDVRSSASELGELDAINIRASAARQAYGYQTQAEGFKSQSTLDVYEGQQDVISGEIGAGSTLLGGVSSGTSSFSKFQAAGAFNASPDVAESASGLG